MINNARHRPVAPLRHPTNTGSAHLPTPEIAPVPAHAHPRCQVKTLYTYNDATRLNTEPAARSARDLAILLLDVKNGLTI